MPQGTERGRGRGRGRGVPASDPKSKAKAKAKAAAKKLLDPAAGMGLARMFQNKKKTS